jgi:hypothetical protein
MKFNLGTLSIETLATQQLSTAQWEELWSFATLYVDATREAYEKSIRGKNEIVLVRDKQTRKLVGLGAVDLYPMVHRGVPCWVIFLGNTVFSEEHRGKNIVEKTGFLYYLRLRVQHPSQPIYLSYVTFSYKSFRMLSRNFREYWPHMNQATPAAEAELIDHLGAKYYKELWVKEEQLARGSPVYNLKSWVAEIDEERLKDPQVRFFVQKNPGYKNGDSLFCLVPLHYKNWLSVFGSLAKHTLKIK